MSPEMKTPTPTETAPPAMINSENAAAVPPSLLEAYGDQEVTFRGVTGTLANLAGLCPVSLEDMDPQKKEQWAGNILTENGVEIPAELMPPALLEEPATAEDEADAKKKLN